MGNILHNCGVVEGGQIVTLLLEPLQLLLTAVEATLYFDRDGA